MNTIKLIAIINLLFIFSCSAQVKNSTKDTQNGFIIGNYMILPEQKEIRIKTRIGGKNWDGYTYQKDSKIDYTTTTMLIIGDQIFFKEYFPYSFNLDKLRNITQGLCKG